MLIAFNIHWFEIVIWQLELTAAFELSQHNISPVFDILKVKLILIPNIFIRVLVPSLVHSIALIQLLCSQIALYYIVQDYVRWSV